jgi:CHAT domain-containing protein
VVDAIANSHVVHLAAHRRAQADELASGLWLAGRTPAQSLISAARVHAGPALQETSLVVLSACDTARHPEGGAGIQTWRGLDSAFLSRGARAVVGSLWRIADTAALVYSAVLHGTLARGTTIVGAHSAATAVLRGKSVDSRSAALLDWVRPTWRYEMRSHGADRAYWWSAYRLSGICW